MLHYKVLSPVIARGKGRRRAAGRARKEEDEENRHQANSYALEESQRSR